MERILNMILRRLMNKGLNTGMRSVSQRGQNDGRRDGDDRRNGRNAKPNGHKNALGRREAMRLLRKLNKF